ncbi:MAG: 30S ribosome-binding factor RbfA [Gammaproteobacteria bacterium]|nr:30S ribosome-binding factor RbfA [Gammaproteobacteria bacterium]
MPREFSRSRRVGEEIRRTLAQLVHDEVKDPGVGMVTLTAVRMSPDLAHARVYFTALADDDEARTSSEKALRRAAGFLRRELGRRIKLRNTPELQFVYDRSVDEGRRLSALIDDAVARDADDDAT